MSRGRLLFSLLLGLATTLATAWALALYLPIEKGRGTVAIDGDHLQPWLIHIHRPGASRTIYFEKGRIYSKAGIGPPGGSSAAVACWSFATSTRSNPNFTRGEVTISDAMKAEMARTSQPQLNSAAPPTAWGIAEDSRGWPLPAFQCTFIGTTAPDSLYTYIVQDGVRRDPPTGTRESLAEIKALPVRPLWRGLIINSALASAAWYLTLSLATAGLTALKSRIHKPGHCPKCNYDLSGLNANTCPECGRRQT